ncbi:MAG: RNA 2',3'-cyclic phosphodiesterase [Anaerolineae bacterium]|nr:RNA 2',3'-cyclic phosphodiesterase [Anaerolineae bacterium]
MAEMVRAFVAIELSPGLVEALGALMARLRKELPASALRWVRPEGIHLTLQFLGNVPAEQVPAIVRALEGACAEVPPLTMEVGGLGCFPDVRRPRVLWVGVEEPTGQLLRLQRHVAQALEPLGYEPDRRGFHPHLTLARAARSARPADLRQVGAWVASAEPTVLGSLQADHVSLMRSDLRPTGAVYTRLAAVALGG